ncbi:hypothetical protein AB6A40_009802 [Gnathostoma spinigerum]|uniref:Uncharacterized protein n=1 Tax=Gnathostoma spinigerum TaxID=75299 RepID=A0ABD6ET12_9BILA
MMKSHSIMSTFNLWNYNAGAVVIFVIGLILVISIPIAGLLVKIAWRNRLCGPNCARPRKWKRRTVIFTSILCIACLFIFVGIILYCVSLADVGAAIDKFNSRKFQEYILHILHDFFQCSADLVNGTVKNEPLATELWNHIMRSAENYGRPLQNIGIMLDTYQRVILLLINHFALQRERVP